MVCIRKHIPVVVDKDVLHSWLSTALLTLLMGGAVALTMQLVWKPDASWSHSFFALLSSVFVGIIVMIIGSTLLKRPELFWMLGRHR